MRAGAGEPAAHLEEAQQHRAISGDRHGREEGPLVGFAAGPFRIRLIGSQHRAGERPLERIRALRREQVRTGWVPGDHSAKGLVDLVVDEAPALAKTGDDRCLRPVTPPEPVVGVGDEVAVVGQVVAYPIREHLCKCGRQTREGYAARTG